MAAPAYRALPERDPEAKPAGPGVCAHTFRPGSQSLLMVQGFRVLGALESLGALGALGGFGGRLGSFEELWGLLLKPLRRAPELQVVGDLRLAPRCSRTQQEAPLLSAPRRSTAGTTP